jgi:hypothetical protein
MCNVKSVLMNFKPCYIELIMKKYRIRNYCTSGYIVQKRILLISWYTLSYTDNRFCRTRKVFDKIENAKAYIKEKIERQKELKKAKYIEYV